MNIQEFKDRIENWSKDLEDTLGNTSDMQLSEWDLEYTPKGLTDGKAESLFGSEIVVAGTEIYNAPMLEQAQSQLAGRLKIPTRWIQDPEKCPVALRELVFNWKFENQNSKDYFLRLKNGNIRAVLSDQFTAFDHIELFDAVQNALEMGGMLPHFELARGRVGDTMSAYFVAKDTEFDAGLGGNGPMGDGGGSGGLKPAFYISNSEIGTGKTRIQGGLYRSFCKNGMILGWKADNAFEIIHRHINRKQIALRANEAIVEALKLSEVAAKNFIEAQHQFIAPSSIPNLINKWAGKYGLTVGQKETWLEAVTIGKDRTGQVSYADLVNEATYRSHGTEDSELAQTFERMAGEMVFAEVPRNTLLESQVE